MIFYGFCKFAEKLNLIKPQLKARRTRGSHPGHRQVGPGGRAAPPGRVKAKACLDPAPGRAHARSTHAAPRVRAARVGAPRHWVKAGLGLDPAWWCRPAPWAHLSVAGVAALGCTYHFCQGFVMLYLSANLKNAQKIVPISEKCETYFVGFVSLRSTQEKCFFWYVSLLFLGFQCVSV